MPRVEPHKPVAGVSYRRPELRHIEWADFCQWTSGRKVVKTDDYNESGCTIILYEDGAVAKVHSSFEDDYSDVTPGGGLQPPYVEVKDPQ